MQYGEWPQDRLGADWPRQQPDKEIAMNAIKSTELQIIIDGQGRPTRFRFRPHNSRESRVIICERLARLASEIYPNAVRVQD